MDTHFVWAIGDDREETQTVTFDSESVENNIVIRVNGKEFGTLFFARDGKGSLEVMLGQFDPQQQEWVDRNPIQVLPDEYQVPIG